MTEPKPCRYERICYGCDTTSDATANQAAMQAMLDQLNAEIAADGWPGVSVAGLSSRRGTLFIEIEHGTEALTLELLRAVRARQSAERMARPAEPEQRSMF